MSFCHQNALDYSALSSENLKPHYQKGWMKLLRLNSQHNFVEIRFIETFLSIPYSLLNKPNFIGLWDECLVELISNVIRSMVGKSTGDCNDFTWELQWHHCAMSIDWKSFIVRKRIFMVFLINFVHQSHSTIFHQISLHLIFLAFHLFHRKLNLKGKKWNSKKFQSLPSLNNLLVYSTNSDYKFSVWLFSRSTLTFLTCVESANRQNEI